MPTLGLAIAMLLCAAPPAPASTSAGKTIEVRPEPLAPGEITQAENCALRMQARCAAARRCPTKEPASPLFISEEGAVRFRNSRLPCDRLGDVCAGLKGKARYPRREVEACAKATAAVRCAKLQWESSSLRVMLNPERDAPACARLVALDEAQPPWLHASPEETREIIERQVECERDPPLIGSVPPPRSGDVQRAEAADERTRAPPRDAGR